jgi:predicted TIM-barrel fold metal-dependent hydrolase
MISLNKFRSNLLPLFRIMISSGMYVDVNYKGSAYRVTVQDLRQKVKRHGGGRRKMVVTIDDVASDKCPACNKLMLAGACMNSACPTRLPVKPQATE